VFWRFAPASVPYKNSRCCDLTTRNKVLKKHKACFTYLVVGSQEPAALVARNKVRQKLTFGVWPPVIYMVAFLQLLQSCPAMWWVSSDLPPAPGDCRTTVSLLICVSLLFWFIFQLYLASRGRSSCLVYPAPSPNLPALLHAWVPRLGGCLSLGTTSSTLHWPLSLNLSPFPCLDSRSDDLLLVHTSGFIGHHPTCHYLYSPNGRSCLELFLSCQNCVFVFRRQKTYVSLR
jgi:hypothetical protein